MADFTLLAFPVRAMALRAGALVVVGVIAGGAINATRRDGLRASTFEAPTTCAGDEHHAAAGTGVGGDEATGNAAGAPARTITPTKAASLCGHDDVVVLDARPAKRYAEGHVADAVHLPCDATGNAVHSAIEVLDKASTVIVYGESTDDAAPVVASLRSRLSHDARDRRVLVLEGGFAAWEHANLSCASGPCSECKEASHK